MVNSLSYVCMRLFRSDSLTRSLVIQYRGYEWEKYGTFCERMLSKHPGSQLLKTPGDPPVDIRFGTDQHIQVTAVTPEPNRTLPIFTCPDVPPAVRSYYEHRQVVYARMGILVLSVGDSSVNAFSSTRPITKPDREGNEEVWLEKTCYTTEQAFPTVLRRSDITEWEVVEISPVDHAYNEVEQKTRELDSLHLRYSALAKTTQVFSTNALSMTLNSVVDPPAESIPGYREAFFNLAYVTRHSDREEQVERLRTAIDDHVSCVPFFFPDATRADQPLQVRVIDSCLKLHGHICPPEMLRFHQTMEELFRKHFAEEIGRIAAQGGFEDVSAHVYARVTDPSSQHEDASLQRSVSSSGQSSVPGLSLSVTVPSQPASPLAREQAEMVSPVKRTPLQLHAAHVARHGINAVSSGWRQDTMSSEGGTASPRNSLITVGNGPSMIGPSGASIVMSTVGSIKGRFSRFGSLRSGRRG